MKRMNDLIVGEGKDSRGIIHFTSINNPEERRNFYLVSNYHEEGRLIPSEKGADFFLIVNDVLPASQEKAADQPDPENTAGFGCL